VAARRHPLLVFMSYSLLSEELALRRDAPQRLIFHWEGSNKTGDSYKNNFA